MESVPGQDAYEGCVPEGVSHEALWRDSSKDFPSLPKAVALAERKVGEHYRGRGRKGKHYDAPFDKLMRMQPMTARVIAPQSTIKLRL